MCFDAKNMILLSWCVVLVTHQIGVARGNFYAGKVDYNEMDRHHGVMTPREAVFICDDDKECAGFSFNGPKSMVDEPFDIIFYSAIIGPIQSATAGLWSTFVKRIQFTTYSEQLPSSDQKFNSYITLNQEPVFSQEHMANLCKRYNCAAVSLHRNGTVRLYSHLYLDSWTSAPGWKTMFNLNPVNYTESLAPKILFNDVNRCCKQPEEDISKEEDFKFHVPRVPCNMTQEEFTEKVIRPKKSVILTGCESQYPWLKDIDISLEAATKMFYDNATLHTNPFDILPNSFTHQNTPNDYFEDNDQTMQKFANGYLRMFERLRRNTNCKVRGNDCDKFGNMRPAPIPEDICNLIGYQNDLDWMIMSAKDTGSNLHNDPDMMGAWNYLINGKKHWVVFPEGDGPSYGLQCDYRCSDQVESGDDVKMWFNSILPQIIDKPVLGKPILQAIQKPGEAIYLPRGVPHTILNIEDNVAVTENHLFVDGVPAFINHMLVLDDIRPWRPDFDVVKAYKNMYNSNVLNKKDRLLIRETLEQLNEHFVQFPHAKTNRQNYNKVRVDKKYNDEENYEEENYEEENYEEENSISNYE